MTAEERKAKLEELNKDISFLEWGIKIDMEKLAKMKKEKEEIMQEIYGEIIKGTTNGKSSESKNT